MDIDIIFARYYNLSLRYLSYRPRSEKEVLDYLKEKQKKSPALTDEIIFSIISKLQEYKFINDLEFAKFWIKQRTQFRNKPLRIINYELRQKGISQSMINEMLDDQENRDMDYVSAKKLAEKKLDFYRGLEPEKRREKVMNYLLRKGFSYDIVKKIFR